MSARSITTAFVAGAFATLVPYAFAQGAMAPPKPAPEMKNLTFFGGNWSCAGQGAMEPGGPMMKMDSSVQSTTGLGGFWQVGTVKGSPMAGMPALEGMFHMTWDPAAKDYVMFWVDNMGGWSQTRSPGWQGDTIAFTGDTQMGAQKMRSRETFVKKADGTMNHIGEMEAGGKWTKMMDETCRKPGTR
jgi:hypothetical protein